MPAESGSGGGLRLARGSAQARAGAGGGGFPALLPGRAGRLPGIIWGKRYNQERGCWEELYGRKVRLVFGLDLYAPGPDGAPALRTAFDVVAGALQREGPEGLKLLELSCGEVEDDPGTDLLRCPAEAVCEGWLYAVADEAARSWTLS